MGKAVKAVARKISFKVLRCKNPPQHQHAAKTDQTNSKECCILHQNRAQHAARPVPHHALRFSGFCAGEWGRGQKTQTQPLTCLESGDEDKRRRLSLWRVKEFIHHQCIASRLSNSMMKSSALSCKNIWYGIYIYIYTHTLCIPRFPSRIYGIYIYIYILYIPRFPAGIYGMVYICMYGMCVLVYACKDEDVHARRCVCMCVCTLIVCVSVYTCYTNTSPCTHIHGHTHTNMHMLRQTHTHTHTHTHNHIVRVSAHSARQAAHKHTYKPIRPHKTHKQTHTLIFIMTVFLFSP